MKVFNHVFFEHGDQKFYDYKGYDVDELTRGDNTTPETPIIDCQLAKKLESGKFREFTDNTFVLKEGDPIHVVPDCIYAIRDVRNKYKIKRSFDTGVCNVFSPLRIYGYSMYPTTVVVVPVRKSIFFISQKTDKRTAIATVNTILPDTIGLSSVNFLVCEPSRYYHQFQYDERYERYLPLLTQNSKTPNISYEQLKLSDEELTTDVLLLCYNAGLANWNAKDAEANYILQLSVLNQHNWRDYPGTINVYSHIMRKNHGIHNEMYGHSSRYQKHIREIFSFSDYGRLSNNPKFNGAKDFNLAVKFVSVLIGINQYPIFASPNGILNKLQEVGIDLELFEKLFKTVIRITNKEYEDIRNDNGSISNAS